MTFTNEQGASWPDRIAVIGGGRWSRVLAETLCRIVPQSVRLSVHSPHNAEAAAIWVSARKLGERIHVSSEWPRLSSERPNAVIVANAARDHEKTVDWALRADIPVLVEKPVALSAAAARRLADLARHRCVPLAAANVFLFTRYLEKFSRLVANETEITFLRVRWMDPKFESRYGETKRFDPGLPIFADWLPHVLSIVGTLMPGRPHKCESLRFFRGGAHLELELTVGSIPCSVQLVRNGDQRHRIIEVATSEKVLQLNFSTEPGSIIADSTIVNGDPDWNVREGPIALMLRAFLRWATGGQLDPRLDIGIGLGVCQVVDQTLNMYNAALLPWLAARLKCPGDADDDLRYALGEILQVRGSLAAAMLDREIEQVREQFLRTPDTGWLSGLIKTSAEGES